MDSEYLRKKERECRGCVRREKRNKKCKKMQVNTLDNVIVLLKRTEKNKIK